MTDETNTDNKMEIAHVLIMDLVGYSTLLLDEQKRVLGELKFASSATAFDFVSLKRRSSPPADRGRHGAGILR